MIIRYVSIVGIKNLIHVNKTIKNIITDMISEIFSEKHNPDDVILFAIDLLDYRNVQLLPRMMEFIHENNINEILFEKIIMSKDLLLLENFFSSYPEERSYDDREIQYMNLSINYRTEKLSIIERTNFLKIYLTALINTKKIIFTTYAIRYWKEYITANDYAEKHLEILIETGKVMIHSHRLQALKISKLQI